MFVSVPPAISIPVPPAPPGRRQVAVLAFSAEVRCAGQPVARDGLVLPRSVTVTRFAPEAAVPAPAPIRLRFRIDEQGRARTIRREPGPPFPGYYVDTSDLGPSLATSRFPAGAAQVACEATYSATSTPVELAPAATLYELASRRDAGSAPELWDRVRPAGSSCQRGPGQYRRLNLPAFERIPQPAGTSSWIFLAFDVDQAGRPRDMRILGSGGNAELDRAGLRALAVNRYAPGPGYRGCTYHFRRDGRATPEPVDLPADAPADTGQQPGCVVDPKTIAGLLNGSAYPRTFSRRRVDGVAAIRYDTAPWGQVGNVTVLAAEPDEAFGETARAAFSAARVAESETGRRGCVQRIRFRPPPE